MGFSHFIDEGFALCEDCNNDGWVSAAEVFEYAKPRTEDWIEATFGWGQHPVSYYGKAGGDVPLVQGDATKAFPASDVAVVSVQAEKALVICPKSVTVSIVVENQGPKPITSCVTLLCDNKPVQKQEVKLDVAQSSTLLFVWGTTGVREGTYTLSAYADPLPGETDTADNACVDGLITVEAARIDLKPDVLKLSSKGGWVTCYIELPEGQSVNDIVVSTIRIEGKIAPAFESGWFGDYDNDGATDQMVKFEREPVITLVKTMKPERYVAGVTYEVTLTVTGRLADETPFEGTDALKITYVIPWSH